MARNKVQFQRGLSDVEFGRLYGTEDNAARRFSPGVGPKASSVRRAGGLGALRAGEARAVAV
jgi:hypothetical protein